MALLRSRQGLEDGLLGLQRDLRSLASLVDVAIERSIRALARLDRGLAESVITDDARINELRFKIEDDAIHLLAQQQPLASDLRTVIAVMNVIVELERMGDYCVGIAKIALLHDDRPLLKPLIDVPRMAELCRDILRASIDAFISRDAPAARIVGQRDDEIDQLYEQVYRELLTFMLNDPRTIDRATWLIWVAHNLERIGDRVQNICERTIFEVTGVMKEFKRARYDA
ncbi:MAG: phosphate signaling complex protein PhoU [Candidatus Limnocylindria bacterium]|nr:phosphate signaling complex protein PhoU [Chloroflexota bacterium]MDQ3401764.1 phosphate signaling complex protein PhoU [Chloroflexota bacterium]